MTTTATFDVTSLATAVEGRDAEGQLGFYLPDAELTLIDHDHGPSKPRVLRGTDAIRTYLVDLCDRDMTHEVRSIVAGEDRVAFEVACRYPDGTRVSCMCVAGISDGRIAWQHQVQAWDN